MKPLVVISCPADTFSGYGARSRDIALPLISCGARVVIETESEVKIIK